MKTGKHSKYSEKVGLEYKNHIFTIRRALVDKTAKKAKRYKTLFQKVQRKKKLVSIKIAVDNLFCSYAALI